MSQNKNIVLNGYSVSEVGEVINNKTGRAIKPSLANNGYLCVRLQYQQKDRQDSRGRSVYYIHRLVASQYVGNPLGLPQVNHIDGDKQNNHFQNLEWVTASQNRTHAYRTGLQKSPKAQLGRFNENHHRSKAINKFTKDGVFVETYPSLQEAKRQGHNIGNVCSALKGNYKTADGFKWEYA